MAQRPMNGFQDRTIGSTSSPKDMKGATKSKLSPVDLNRSRKSIVFLSYTILEALIQACKKSSRDSKNPLG